jgi:hypothetical protein
MTFTPANPNPDAGCVREWHSDTGVVSVGVFRVVFGWRVVAWFTGTDYFNVNWCCGADPHAAQTVMRLLMAILANREEGPDALADLPEMRVKPFYNDIAWLRAVLALEPDYKTDPDAPPLFYLPSAASIFETIFATEPAPP